MITARQYALQHGIPERTVRQWVSQLTDEERTERGIIRAGRAWVAPLEAWEALAAVERRTGPRGADRR